MFMEGRIVGKVKRVNGPVITLRDVNDAQMMEMVRIGEQQLVGEVVKLFDDMATVQVYEDATGICPGDNVYGSGASLSAELGPGLIGTIYDGIQRPLEKLMAASGAFIGRGLTFPAIDHEKKWHFVPSVKMGDAVFGGMFRGERPQKGRLRQFHQIGVEWIGASDPAADAECIIVLMVTTLPAVGAVTVRLAAWATASS